MVPANQERTALTVPAGDGSLIPRVLPVHSSWGGVVTGMLKTSLRDALNRESPRAFTVFCCPMDVVPIGPLHMKPQSFGSSQEARTFKPCSYLRLSTKLLNRRVRSFGIDKFATIDLQNEIDRYGTSRKVLQEH